VKSNVQGGAKLIRSARQAVAIARRDAARDSYRVHVPERIDVKAIRTKLGLSQDQFAARFGISLHTLRKWEQSGRQPEGPARAYLMVIARNPQAVEEALRAA
jgi:putative transcriptional regulator